MGGDSKRRRNRRKYGRMNASGKGERRRISNRKPWSRYEKEQKGLGRIPVLKKVSDEVTRGAVGPHASFLRKPAGLPGGLSLIPVKP